MSRLKFFVGLMVFQSVTTREMFNLPRSAIASTEEEAKRKINSELREYLNYPEKWELKYAAVEEVKRAALEQAAIEVLGWSTGEQSAVKKGNTP